MRNKNLSIPYLPTQALFYTYAYTDLDKIEHVDPIGEVKGDNFTGHTYTGITPGIEKVPIYAPVDMGLVNIVKGQVDYSMQFKISQEVEIEFGHISEPVAEILRFAMYEHIGIFGCHDTVLISYSACDLIAYTSGTIGAKNFDLGVYNITRDLNFINKERYKSVTKWLNASCPFDY